MSAAPRSTGASADTGWLSASSARPCAGLADRSRQCRDQRDDGDRLHDARLAVAARARRGIARLQSLSPALPVRHRRRRGAVADRRLEGRRGRRARRRCAGRRTRRSSPPSLLALVTWLALWRTRTSSSDRRRARSRRDAGTYMPASSGASRRASVLCRSLRSFSRSSGPARRWSPVWSRSRSTRSPIMRSSSASLGMPALGIFGSGLATTLSQTLMFCSAFGASLLDPRLRRLRLFALPWRSARARDRGALAAWPADRGDDRRGGRRLRRGDPGDGPHRQGGARSAYGRAADRLACLHGPARPRPGGDRAGRPRLWRARRSLR